MKYAVKITAQAERDLERAYRWLKEQAPHEADAWLDEITAAIKSLQEFPRRASPASENDQFPSEIRQLLFGKRHGQYRILFIITSRKVRVLHVRHASRRK